MFENFIIYAWLAGIGISLMTGPLGCFIAWQRLAYFGDTVGHGAMLGVVLALLFGVHIIAGVIGIAVLIAFLVSQLQDKYLLHTDSLLGIAAHGSLALALVILSLSPNVMLDINGLLFGDILAVSGLDLFVIFSAAAIIGPLLICHWQRFMRFIVHADIAQVEGQNIKRTQLLMMVMIAIVVAVSIKLVGILLITSLLIIPAAAARMLAYSPTQMAIVATITSSIAVTLGLITSYYGDVPTGPAIILSALTLLIVFYGIRVIKR